MDPARIDTLNDKNMKRRQTSTVQALGGGWSRSQDTGRRLSAGLMLVVDNAKPLLRCGQHYLRLAARLSLAL